ncbi:nucleotidyl transferase AbiEii/AbiGii toxin family protein [Patescibacteria group bacterium]|nr:nucleotidyl transferase AbiEii/AbiGii toxin family protein [Patescibacteria group bacterium]
MGNQTILTAKQKLFLQFFSKNSELVNRFYLTGGTALTAFYIPYRHSEDLDFFSEDEVETKAIAVFFKSIKPKLKYKSIDINKSFNRHLFFLNFTDSVLKVEFTYFPFPQIEVPQKHQGVKVNGILDIAVDKLFTIYQNPRSRDFMDLYMIHKQYSFSLDDLVRKARLKFDWDVDWLKLGSQFLLATELKDYPKLVKPLEESKWQGYFLDEAKKIGRKIFNH